MEMEPHTYVFDRLAGSFTECKELLAREKIIKKLIINRTPALHHLWTCLVALALSSFAQSGDEA
jgi:hypothetical protein